MTQSFAETSEKLTEELIRHQRSHCQSSVVALRHISSGDASRDYVLVPETH